MQSVDRTSGEMPLTVSFHFDKWRISLKKRPCGWSGLASTSPLGLETRKVEPSRMLTLLSLIETLLLYPSNQAPTCLRRWSLWLVTLELSAGDAISMVLDVGESDGLPIAGSPSVLKYSVVCNLRH